MVATRASGRPKELDLGGWVCADQMSIEDELGTAVSSEPITMFDPPQTRNGPGDG